MKLAITVISLFTLSQSAFALPNIGQLMGERFGQTWNAPQASGNCTNFVGTWEGSCSVGGHSAPDTMKIAQQGCFSIVTANEYDIIGGVQTVSYTGEVAKGATMVLTGTKNLDWNKAKTELNGKFQGQIKFLGVEGATPIDAEHRMYLDGGELKIEGQLFGQKLECKYQAR